MKRRQVLAAALSAFALDAVASSKSARGVVHVVKLLLFSCPVCRASEAIDPAISKAVLGRGGRLVSAPLPVDSAAREKVYYAMRDLYSDLESSVRSALYEGTQDAGLPLADPVQVLVWLQSTLTARNVNWSAVVARANSDETMSAIGRAARLSVAAAISDTPTYVLLKDGEVVDTVDPPRAQGSVGQMRELVLSKINSI